MFIKRLFATAAVTFGMLVVPVVAQNSTPQVIKVQGFLSDKNGGTPVPATGTFAMSFDLYDADPGGLLIASVGSLSVEVTEGLYSVELPFGATDFDGAERYIEITVIGETLSPRIRVASAPFAYKAETLDGVEAADLEESAEIVAGDAGLQTQIDALSTQFAGAGNTLDEAYDEGGSGAGRIITADAGPINIEGGLQVLEFVGIGTSSPGPGLDVHVRDEEEAVLRVETSGGFGNVAAIQLKDGQGGWSIATGANDFGGPGALALRTFTEQTVMVIEPSGNVGIGSFTGSIEPAATLHVDGTTRTKVLTITGGADLAEPFNVTSGEAVPDGAVLVIDEGQPGQLRLTDEPYDTRVAGVVSGAGGINPGLTLSQDGIVDGELNVAMAGRVYCLATASNGSIRPGDRLTTSALPGHAMKVTDRDLADGATLGKAMSSLDQGQGLVLVLVNLQ